MNGLDILLELYMQHNLSCDFGYLKLQHIILKTSSQKFKLCHIFLNAKDYNHETSPKIVTIKHKKVTIVIDVSIILEILSYLRVYTQSDPAILIYIN